MDKRIFWVFVLTVIMFATGILWAGDKPQIVPYTETSMQEFLKSPGLQLPETWSIPPGIYGIPPTEWVTYTFILGDTLTTFAVINARVVRFVFADSSLAGVDTMGIKLKITGPTTNFLYPSIMLKPMNDTGIALNSGNVSGDSLYTASGSTIGWEYVPSGEATFTGTFQIYRKTLTGMQRKPVRHGHGNKHFFKQ